MAIVILETSCEGSLTELVMEKEKKRKRSADHGGGGGGGERRTKKEVAEVEDESAVKSAAAASQPSEKEVEEFFSILRRMHVAVKYFEKSGGKFSNINDVNGGSRQMRELTEDRVNGVKIGVKRDVGMGIGGLDLNAVPEAEIETAYFRDDDY